MGDISLRGHGIERERFSKGGSTLKKVDSEKNPGLAKLPTEVRNKMGFMKKGGAVKEGFHKTKDGRIAKKGLYYYMNRAKKLGKSRPGKGTVSDKALKASAKTAKK